ncbi:hypothetical protein [Morganella morganii]|uniref:hypothetical protein n=1 Tax=Morganella morganii TaxID=582 RepID=UPI001BDA36A0|nr:hypothetical protein [Morganella morganii]MBT0422809.1 hypothetical protein [Morganella morganii subsp. morganii]MBT0517383.1 hypothetical protein [Morganella morganii subsp. morganii]QWM05676.1 hypothetical protein IZ185_08240 [Morganella morganii subsp. morganii]
MTENKERATKYYIEIVKPTVDEFMNDECSIRKGMLASITIHHIIDYLYCNSSKSNGFKISSSECDALNTIKDVCNASKHCELTQGKPSIKSSGQIIQEDTPGLFSAPFGTGGFFEANYVFVKLNDEINGDKFRCLPHVIKEAMKYWDKRLLS